MQILYVLPDYYESYPKPCYGGWGRHYLVVMPDGRTLPCHGATHITTLRFDSVRDRPLRWIWEESPAFEAFRGDTWMREPCQTCPQKAVDFGGCRCQAFALTGDATNPDPVCTLTPLRRIIDTAVQEATGPSDYRYRILPLSPDRT
jgi:pyrroloquinoline quinone biosynthesis protein E